MSPHLRHDQLCICLSVVLLVNLVDVFNCQLGLTPQLIPSIFEFNALTLLIVPLSGRCVVFSPPSRAHAKLSKVE